MDEFDADDALRYAEEEALLAAQSGMTDLEDEGPEQSQRESFGMALMLELRQGMHLVPYSRSCISFSLMFCAFDCPKPSFGRLIWHCRPTAQTGIAILARFAIPLQPRQNDRADTAICVSDVSCRRGSCR